MKRRSLTIWIFLTSCTGDDEDDTKKTFIYKCFRSKPEQRVNQICSSFTVKHQLVWCSSKWHVMWIPSFLLHLNLCVLNIQYTLTEEQSNKAKQQQPVGGKWGWCGSIWNAWGQSLQPHRSIHGYRLMATGTQRHNSIPRHWLFRTAGPESQPSWQRQHTRSPFSSLPLSLSEGDGKVMGGNDWSRTTMIVPGAGLTKAIL